jgi:DNA-binding beta-propeller fold protein YncE
MGEARLTTVVGNGQPGYAGDGGPAAQARLNGPFDLVFDGAGNLFFADTFNHCVRRVDAASGRIATVAGTGESGFSGDAGAATTACLNEPYGIALDRTGNLFIVDRRNHRIRRVDAQSAIISTLAEAGLAEPNDVCLDPEEQRLFIADVAGHVVRALDLGSGNMTIVSGTGEARHAGDNGPAQAASLHGPRAVVMAHDGALLILERNGNTLRRIDPATGLIATIAGTGERGYTGDNGPAIAATFGAPKELGIDRHGGLLIVDTENHVIRRIDPTTGLVVTIAGNGKSGGGVALLARPHGVAVGPGGEIYIGDTENHRICKLDRGVAA